MKPFDLGRPADPRKQCWKKKRYLTRDDALERARRIGPEVSVYCCPWSTKTRWHWHVGGNKGRDTLVTTIHIPPAKQK